MKKISLLYTFIEKTTFGYLLLHINAILNVTPKTTNGEGIAVLSNITV